MQKAANAKPSASTFTTGLAIFSMFFGAGNVVFPLAIGQYAQDKNLFAAIGLLISAVGVPFVGLIAMTLFGGNYKHFFDRIGKVPGFLIAAAILGLIGPFGAMPRCIALSYSTIKSYLPDVSLPLFSFLSCVIIFLFSFKRSKIINLIGSILTPILLTSLLIIIVKGIWYAPAMPETDLEAGSALLKGLLEGYQTMDLLGAFFFSSVVLDCLKESVDVADPKNNRKIIMLTLKASCIGLGLLSLTYIGFSFTAAFNGDRLLDIGGKDELINQIALLTLGPYASIVASVAVALACLTTVIALATVFAEFLYKDVLADKIGYEAALVATLIVTFLVSTLNFTGIAAFLLPILTICYPALIVLSILNVLHKLYHVQPVKIPVLVVFLASLGFYLL